MLKKKPLIGIVIVVALIIIGILIFKPKSATIQNWVSEEVRTGSITLAISASGNINPENIYNVNSRTSAKVLEVNVKMGDTVKKGQQLAKLDDTDLQNALKTAQYGFNSAVYTRDQLKNMPVVDDYSVKKAQQQVNSAYVQVQAAKNNLNNAYIYAPADGKILSVNIKADEYAGSASASSTATGLTSTAAFTMGNSDNLQAYLNVNEVDIAKVKIGQDVNLTIDAVAKTISGKVISIDENSTTITGIVYYKVKTSITDITALKPGMSVDSEVIVTAKQNVLVIPASALQQKSGKNLVRILATDNATKMDTAIEKEVAVGINNNTLAEILSGLAVGEKVIVNYNLKASSGATLNIGENSQ